MGRERDDVRSLALMDRLEPRRLHELFHRSEAAQMDLEVIKARKPLVGCRSKLIHHLRGAVKGIGSRLPSGGADGFARQAREHLPPALTESLGSVLDVIEQIAEQIRHQGHLIETLCRKYPETPCLRQVSDVGPVTAPAYVLRLEEPDRFAKSRTAGALSG
jgi:transposase